MNTALIPTLTQMQALDKNLAVTHAGDPGAIAAYRTGAQSVAAANWEAFAGSSGLSPATLATLKPQYDLKTNEEMLQGAGRLGDQQTTYAGTHLVSTVAPALDSAVAAIATDPKLYGPAMQPGGTIEQAAKPLGTGEAADKALAEAKTTATINYVGGLIRTKQYDLAQSELDSGKLDPYLHGDTKLSLENELSKHGPAAAAEAAAAYTDTQSSQLDVAMRASEGTSIFTPQQQARMSQEMSTEAYAKYQVDAHNADLVFQQIGGPISKQPLASLQAIRPPTPADAAADPSMYQARAAAYQAAQAQITQRLKDPAAWAMGQDRGQGVKGGGKPGAPGGSLGDRLQAYLYGADGKSGFAATGAVDVAAGTQYATEMLQSQQSTGIDPTGQNVRLLPEALAADKAGSFEKAEPDHKFDAGMALRNFVQSFPAQISLAHGVIVSPRLLAARELAQAGMKPGDVAAIVDSVDSPAGKIAFGRYVAATNDPNLSKELPAQQGKALYGAVQQAIAKYQQTSTSPGDSWLNPGRMDQVYAQARYLMAKNVGMNATVAAQTAASSLTDGFRFDGAMRMPLNLAQASYQTHATPSAVDIGLNVVASAAGVPGLAPRISFGPRSGYDLAKQGMASARSWGIGNAGVNLSAPPSDLAIGDSKKQYAAVIGNAGVWTNIGDNAVALKVPRPDGGFETVTDKFGRPITMTFQQAIQDGQSGHSLFEKPAPPTAALSTPEGHPIHATTPPIAAAGLAGSIAAHSQGVPPPPPPPPPVSAGSPSVPDSPPPTSSAGLNATQRALASVGASPQVLSLFAGADSGATAPSTVAPQGYEGLNVTPSKAVQLLLPDVIHRESGGDPAAHNLKSGAIGLMQLMPATVAEWAPRLGLPVDLARAQSDPAYNQAIGTALLNSLTQHYMVGAVPNAGIALALAAYDAGPGRVEGQTKNGVHTPGWLTTIGDPRGGQISTDQWISKIPFPETRAYVRAIMDRTTRRLAGVVGAGPPA